MLEAIRARDVYRRLTDELRERVEKLQKGLLGPKSQRFTGEDDSQLSLQILSELLGTSLPQDADPKELAQELANEAAQDAQSNGGDGGDEDGDGTDQLHRRKREAPGRKNWLFVASKDGAEVNATFTTLIASCHLHDIDPEAYLRDVMCLLPDWPKRRVLELAPCHWKQTREQPDTQQRLAACVIRNAILDFDTLHRPSS